MIKKMRDGIHSVRTIDWDRRLFDELIPLPEGTTYNAYLIEGSEKTALIDATYQPKVEEIDKDLNKLQISNIDYIISNHSEGDHSGAIPNLLAMFPKAKVVTNKTCKNLLMEMLLIPEDRFIEIIDRDTLSLGNRTLEFIIAPWVHWPDTMFTYIKEDKMLCTCDFFGSHYSTHDLYVNDEHEIYRAAKRYYAEIMMPFRKQIQNHLKKIEELEIDIIAPSHGPVYDNPGFIIDTYRKWSSDTVKNLVVVPYISMYGSTEKMVHYLIDMLVEKGVQAVPFNLTKTDIGELAALLVDTATVVIGSPTVLTGPHPNVATALFLANLLRPKLKYASIIGSYGWGGNMVEQVKGLLTNLKVELIEPVIIKGHPKPDDYTALDKLANEIFNKHNENTLIMKGD